MLFKSSWTRRVGVVALVAAIGGGAWWWSARNGDETARYRTASPARGDVVQTVSANGTLNPVKLVSVGTQVSGTVKKLAVDFNDRVTAGQVLMQLDDDTFAAQLRQSEANLASARASLALASANATRIEALFKQEYVSKQERDQAQQVLASASAGVDLARAQVDRDRINLAHTVIRSPVSGVVVSRDVDIGQTVAASFQTPTLFRIAQDLTKMQIDSSFAEADIGQVSAGQPARFRVDAWADRMFSGQVRQVRLNPTTQQNVVTYNVVVAVENPDYVLLPGMTANVTIQTAKRTNVLRVPNAALRFRPASEAKPVGAERGNGGPPRMKPKTDASRANVYVLRAGAPVAVPVTLGISDGRFTEITRGEITEQDALVVEDMAAAPRSAAGGAASSQSGFRMRMF